MVYSSLYCCLALGDFMSIWILCLFLMCKNWKEISSHVIWNKERKKPTNKHTKLFSLLDPPQRDGVLFLPQHIIVFKVTNELCSVNREAHSHGLSFLLSYLHPLPRWSFIKSSQHSCFAFQTSGKSHFFLISLRLLFFDHLFAASLFWPWNFLGLRALCWSSSFFVLTFFSWSDLVLEF